jgi:hypothetical protein
MTVLRVYRFCEYTLNCVILFTNITIVKEGVPELELGGLYCEPRK